MKTIILLLATIVSTNAFATSISKDAILARVSVVDEQIKTAYLYESGTLSIEKADGTFKALKLAEANKQDLVSAAKALGHAELVTEQHLVVCMMMISPYSIQNLWVVNAKTGKLRLTLTTESCALSTYIHPKELHQQKMALVLKNEIQALARQLN